MLTGRLADGRRLREFLGGLFEQCGLPGDACGEIDFVTSPASVRALLERLVRVRAIA